MHLYNQINSTVRQEACEQSRWPGALIIRIGFLLKGSTTILIVMTAFTIHGEVADDAPPCASP